MFSLCAAVCLQIFAKASVESARSRDLSQASLRAQTVAEMFKAEGGNVARVAALSGGDARGNEVLIYYDGEWAPAPESKAAFVLSCEARGDGALRTARIVAYDGMEEIIAITAVARAG
jgi:hypothetical protein